MPLEPLQKYKTPLQGSSPIRRTETMKPAESQRVNYYTPYAL